MTEAGEEWTSVERKPRNKANPHNKHKKAGKAERVSVKVVKSSHPNGVKAVSNAARTEKVNHVRTEVAVVSPDQSKEGNETAVRAESKAWASVPTFINEQAPMELSMSSSMKQMSISEINPDQVDPARFAQLCRSFDCRTSPFVRFQTRGLVNTGCACFRNSILQALVSLPAFMSLVGSILREVEDPLNIPPPFVTWRELISLYKEFTPARTSSSGFNRKSRHTVDNIHANLHMNALFSSFSGKMAAFRPPRQGGKAGAGSQEDAMEFLTFLLDNLHEEIAQYEAANPTTSTTGTSRESSDSTEISRLSSTVSLVSTLAEAADSLLNDGWNTVFTKKTDKTKVVVDDKSKDIVAKASDASVISKLFHATLRSEVHYKNKKERSVTFQRLFCVTLDIASTVLANSSPRHAPVTIAQCLDQFFSEESIDDNIKKQLLLDTLPDILVLQLSRFSFDHYRNVSTKIMREVDFPLELELSPERHMSAELAKRLSKREGSEDSEGNAAAYELSSVVLHHGENVSKGHYSTLSRDSGAGGESDEVIWRSLNDTKVSTVSETQVLSSSSRALVYLLFYSRKAALPN